LFFLGGVPPAAAMTSISVMPPNVSVSRNRPSVNKFAVSSRSSASNFSSERSAR
jgi:hypothetical protein